jgi:hypothetical protein
LIEAAENNKYEFVETLKDRDRGMILLLLDKIVESGNKELIPILKAWQMIDYKKVSARIQEVIDELGNGEDQPKMDHKKEVISFGANKKWLAIPAATRKELERNVWCSTCSDVVQIVNYVVQDSPPSIALKGKCKDCGKDVARFID